MTRCPTLARLCGVLALLEAVASQPVETMTDAEIAALDGAP